MMCLWSQARRLLDEAHARLGALNVKSYTALIKGYVKAGHMLEAQTLLREMQSLNVAPNAVWCGLAFVLGRSLELPVSLPCPGSQSFVAGVEGICL